MTEAWNADLKELWNLGPGWDADRAWAPRSVKDLYRIPIGVDGSGCPVELDFKEAEHGGMGRHGLCIGATGSGKSELLRTIVLGLMATHSPADVNFLLAETMGFGTFGQFEHAPHVSAAVPGSSTDFSLVSRLGEVLTGELNRRMELLNTVQVKNFWDYRARWQAAEQHCSELLPALFVVIDEFSELLSFQSDFAEVLQLVGRLARPLGIHMLLASQRLEEQKAQPFEKYISYRIALRTFNSSESRMVIGTADAAELPTEGGFGYLRVGNDLTNRSSAGCARSPLRRWR